MIKILIKYFLLILIFSFFAIHAQDKNNNDKTSDKNGTIIKNQKSIDHIIQEPVIKSSRDNLNKQSIKKSPEYKEYKIIKANLTITQPEKMNRIEDRSFFR